MKSKKNTKSGKLSLFRLFRGALATLFVCAICLLVGSIYIRKVVLSRLEARSVYSSTRVVTAPLLLKDGLDVESFRLKTRLQRLSYSQVTQTPRRPGQFQLTPLAINIYFRSAQLPGGESTREKLVSLKLDKRNRITQIVDLKKKSGLKTISNKLWLEPETISLLQPSAERFSQIRPLKDFPKELVEALIAIEDERFYSHFGIDLWSISRALWVNMKAGSVVQGGSTITQQLAKNLLLSSERTISRKISEAFVAILLDASYSKEQILEFYLNEVFLAQEGNIAIHGFAAGSESLYNVDIGSLSLAQSAELAGLVKGPSRYSPRKHPKRAKKRRALVLSKMREQGVISKEQFQEALEAETKAVSKRRSRRSGRYFVDFVRGIVELGDTTRVGQTVHSGIDMEYQICAEKALSQGLEKLEKSRKGLAKIKLQAALVSVSPQSGIIRSWVGGRSYGKNQFDRVSQAKRQPGSAFKPFVYLTALDGTLNNYRTARTTTLLDDSPISIDVPGSGLWTPQNYDRKFRGEVTLRRSLAMSLNIPTVELAQKVGIENVAKTAMLFGFGSDLPAVPSLALGAGEVTPLELARAYSSLANGGELLSLSPVTAITEPSSPIPLFEYQLQVEPAATPAATFVLSNILQTVIENGTGQVVRRLGYKGPVAGKTGTSNDSRDAWFAGYTPNLLTVVWVGDDDNQPTGLTGGSGAAPIWTEFNKCIQKMEPDIDFLAPPGVVYKEIDSSTGLLANDHCPRELIVTEIFVDGVDPITPCNIHFPQHEFSGYGGQYDSVGDSNRQGSRRRQPRERRRSKNVVESIFDRLFN